MRRGKASGRGPWLLILLAGVAGFLIGDWHATSSRPSDVFAAENVALRSSEVGVDVAVANVATDAPTSAVGATLLGDGQFALLSPQPMVPLRQQPAPPQAAAREPAAAAPRQTVATHQVAPMAAMPPESEVNTTAATQPRAEPERAAENAVRHASRPGFLLNDAQIASIKARLHLTPDQERMWPAVEAALRKVAYVKARGHQRGAPGSSAAVASLGPDSAEVQGLKSAAVPLIMSFSDQQKSEVRSLAHVMGLDKIASEL